MPNIVFDLLHEYDPGKPGITIPVELKIGQQSVKASAKLDTGSTLRGRNITSSFKGVGGELQLFKSAIGRMF